MPKQTYDVCVVGSGPGGGIAAYALAQAGLMVALVEAGPPLRAGVDYNAHGLVHEHLDHRLSKGRSMFLSVTDFSERNHFTPVGDNPGHGLLKALGGRSLCWAGHSLRFGPLDFNRWPIRYEEVAPYYARAERLMGVYGHKDGLWNMPDGEFLKPVALRCGEQMLRRGAERVAVRRMPGMRFVPLRKAMPTDNIPGHIKCHYCGHCMAGCEVNAKYTSANTPIPLALHTGRLTLLTNSTMTQIRMKDARRVAGIDYIQEDGRDGEVDCRALVLACSAVETARQLLANNLANSSSQVGRNLVSHFGVTVTGVFPELKGRDASNDDGTDYYHGLLSGLYWDQPSRRFEGTYQVQCGSGLHPKSMPVRNIAGYGRAFKRQLRELNVTHAGMNMQGSLLASSKKFVDLDLMRRDRYGVPLPQVHLTYEDNEIAMAEDMVGLSEEIITAAGGRVQSTPGAITPAKLVIDSNHWVGTARMGDDPKTSVVNRDSQSHDIPNLFVGDASVFTWYPEKNPTLTNIALSWRMAERLAQKARRGEI